MAKYRVVFGAVNVGVVDEAGNKIPKKDQLVGVGGILELDESDPLVTAKHALDPKNSDVLTCQVEPVDAPAPMKAKPTMGDKQ